MASKAELQYQIELVMDSEKETWLGRVCAVRSGQTNGNFYITKEVAERVRRVNGFIG